MRTRKFKMTKLAIIRIRGPVKINKKIEETMKLLKLEKRNNCRVFEETPSIRGMVEKIKDYVTWGTIDSETEKALEKRTTNNVARLNPPRGGFERKGIKLPYKKGGALGNREDKIKELILKMV